jgi:hypothetical protein
MMKIAIFGIWSQGEVILLNLLTVHFSLALLPLSLGSVYGNPGHLINVRYFFGWQFATGAGQQIDWRKEGCLTLRNALYVIKRTRQFITY